MPIGVRTATRVRKVKVDKLSTTAAGAATEIDLTGLIILPREAFEEGRGWVTYEGWDIYVLPSSRVIDGETTRAFIDGDIVSSDQLRIDGQVWQVDGPPAPYDKGATRKATRIRVKRVGT